MDRVVDEKKDIAYFKNVIPELVKEYYSECGVDEAKIIDAPLNTWSACMRFINRECISRDDLMEDYEIGQGGHNKRYNTELVGVLCNIFLEMCETYDKTPSLWAFALLIGADRVTLEKWLYNYQGGLSLQHSNITKKIKMAREASLANRIVDGRKNPVGAIAALNHEFAWNSSTVIDVERIDKPLSAAELPILDSTTGKLVGRSLEASDRLVEIPESGDSGSINSLPILF